MVTTINSYEEAQKSKRAEVYRIRVAVLDEVGGRPRARARGNFGLGGHFWKLISRRQDVYRRKSVLAVRFK